MSKRETKLHLVPISGNDDDDGDDGLCRLSSNSLFQNPNSRLWRCRQGEVSANSWSWARDFIVAITIDPLFARR